MVKRTCWFLLLAACLLNAAHAALTIEITEGVDDALPIAIVPFQWSGPGPAPENIAQIITADLNRSGQFEALPEQDMLAKPAAPKDIKFNNWRVLGIPNLLIGQLHATDTEDLVVEFRLFDVFQQKQLAGFRYRTKPGQLRNIAHKVSDIVYEELTGIKGAFGTDIVYIKKFSNKDPKPYRLYLADADGFNEQEIMRHHMPIFSPTWSPDNSQLAFAMAGSMGQGVFLFDVATGKSPVRITPREVKASAPSWSPDGKKLALQVLENGSADIFIMDVSSKKMQRITKHWSIDAEPSWSPDGQSIIFTSERGGTAQLYQYSFAEKKIKRLTFKGRSNLRAAHSPDGKMITFVHLSSNNGYNIAVMDLATEEMRLVAGESNGESEHESPSFAPNGSMIIYAANYLQKSTRSRKTGLVAVSVDGAMRQHFVDNGIGEVREPAWSSFLN